MSYKKNPEAHPAASALGSIKTLRKAKTSRENGKKGGRPTNQTVAKQLACDLQRLQAKGYDAETCDDDNVQFTRTALRLAAVVLA